MTRLEVAGVAWGEGRLVAARRGYQALLQTDPTAWGALFQLAWLDGIFGKLLPDRVRALGRPGLSVSARNMIAALDGMAAHPMPLEGGEQEWDIGALRRRSQRETGQRETSSSWWEARGKTASKAGLYGVALACFEEAERREPDGAYWDPPAWTHSLPAQVDEHLKLVADPFAR